jgi:hypothetical protein
MKLLIVFILTMGLVALGSESRFEKIAEPKAMSVLKAVKTFAPLAEITSGDQSPVAPYSVKFKAGGSEKVEKNVRDYIVELYKSHPPDEVFLKEVERSKAAYDDAAYDAIQPLDYIDEIAAEIGSDIIPNEVAKNFSEQIQAMLSFHTLKVFELSYGDMNAGCGGIAVVDTWFKEFTLFQSCWID